MSVIPTVARLYEQNGYRRASVTSGPGEPLVRREDALREIERLREALREIEAHHVEQNDLRGRPHHRSKTLTIARQALQEPRT